MRALRLLGGSGIMSCVQSFFAERFGLVLAEATKGFSVNLSAKQQAYTSFSLVLAEAYRGV